MKLYIYRSSLREGLYVYLNRKDDIDKLPAPVLKQLGNPEFAMTIDLTEKRRLGRDDSSVVVENIANDGFHLQMPRDIESLLSTTAAQTTADSVIARDVNSGSAD